MPAFASPAIESPATTSTRQRKQRDRSTARAAAANSVPLLEHLADSAPDPRPGRGAILVTARKIADGHRQRDAGSPARSRCAARVSSASSTRDHANTLAASVRSRKTSSSERRSTCSSVTRTPACTSDGVERRRGRCCGDDQLLAVARTTFSPSDVAPPCRGPAVRTWTSPVGVRSASTSSWAPSSGRR